MQHLRTHRGSVLAAGINLMLAETTTAAAQVAGMLTLDGHCKTMDAAADGYVRRASTCYSSIFNFVVNSVEFSFPTNFHMTWGTD